MTYNILDIETNVSAEQVLETWTETECMDKYYGEKTVKCRIPYKGGNII